VTSIKSKLIEEKIKISICDFTEIDAQRKIMLFLLIEFKKVTSGDKKQHKELNWKADKILFEQLTRNQGLLASGVWRGSSCPC
jgi:hypothetical protein